MQIHLYTSRLAARTASTLQSHNIALGPDGKGLRVGVRAVAHETYAAKVQEGLVGAWNAAELQPSRAMPASASAEPGGGRRSRWSGWRRTAPAQVPGGGAGAGVAGGGLGVGSGSGAPSVGSRVQGFGLATTDGPVRTTGLVSTAASARQARPQGPRAQSSAGASAGAAAAARGAASR